MDQTVAAPVPQISLDDPTRFINRELSWLDFNFRVVSEAENPRHPLLERLRFISISASNLDEFYSVRVAGLIGQARAGILERSADGATPAQQLHAINIHARELLIAQQKAFSHVRALLAAAGIVICSATQLTSDDAHFLDSYFMERVFPVLTPLAVDP
ncbi:MAG TPA: RNA degradosome polyphosphate kinase, partial [Acidocella sp.]|nr:RNA degradosome polyphosphate kinase [Acidocella sp.]